MDFINYLMDEALIIVPVLWFLGYAIKKSGLLPHWAIIWVLIVVGVLFSAWHLGGFTADNVMQGIIVAAVAVLGHQLFRQSDEAIRCK